MKNPARIPPPMAAAKEPTTGNRTGTWRFERPVFTSRLAPCSEACPLGQDIPAIMGLNSRGSFDEAFEKILEENPFPGICGKVCFHPCERVCNRAGFDEAVSIQDLEWFAFHETMTRDLPKKGKEAGESRVAVLGGGVAGLSFAYFMMLCGRRVTLFEEGRHLSLLDLAAGRVGLEQEDLEREARRVLDAGVAVETGAPPREALYPELSRTFHALYSAPAQNTRPSRKTEQVHRHESGLFFIEEEGEITESSKADLSRNLVRLMAAGKRAAMSLDLSLKGLPAEGMEAVAVGRLGAYSMEAYLSDRGEGPSRPLGDVVRMEHLNPAHFVKMPRIRPSTRQGRFTRNLAVASARRCFQCGTCNYCGRCYDFCPDLAILMDGERKSREIDYDHCKGCGICAEECPRAAVAWAKE